MVSVESLIQPQDTKERACEALRGLRPLPRTLCFPVPSVTEGKVREDQR